MAAPSSTFPEDPPTRPRLSGILPPLVTPFTPEGDVDYTDFEANLEAYAAHALAGALVLGSNGEAGSLDLDEKLELVRLARAGMSSDRFLLVGTGLESTRGTQELTRQAADLGADAVLVLPPHYYRAQMTADALARHYETVAEAAPIPVLLYSVPQFTGLPLSIELAVRAATHPNIVGLKESSGDVAQVARLAERCAPGFAVMSGAAPVFYPSLCVGARGGILAVACCAPRAVLGLYEAFREGRHGEARRRQAALTPLAEAVTGRYGVAGLKLSMDLAGFRGGAVRSPLLPAPAEAADELRGLLAAAEQA